jgi:hypothetical protein
LNLHSCQKRWQLDELGGKVPEGEEEKGSIHFAFGHAVGAGIQTLFLPGKTKQDAQLACLLAWDVPLDETLPEKKKSFWYALRAMDLAEHLVREIQTEGWELAVLQDIPAVEFSFVIDLPDGFTFAAHVDLILYHLGKDKYRIVEVKTDFMTTPNEAKYGNSSQGLAYSIALDYLVKHKTSYDVLYVIYSCPSMQFFMFPFPKSNLAKVEWLRDILYDCEIVKNLIKTNYFPKRGESCFNFFKVCPYYGGCGYGDEYLGINSEKILDVLIQKKQQNTKINQHNKRGYDIRIPLEELLKDRMLVLEKETT